eukprot:3893589-Pyramimonas_sp.AAC.1
MHGANMRDVSTYNRTHAHTRRHTIQRQCAPGVLAVSYTHIETRAHRQQHTPYTCTRHANTRHIQDMRVGFAVDGRRGILSTPEGGARGVGCDRGCYTRRSSKAAGVADSRYHWWSLRATAIRD